MSQSAMSQGAEAIRGLTDVTRTAQIAESGLLARPFRRAAESAWRRLPLPVTAALGGWIYGRL